MKKFFKKGILEDVTALVLTVLTVTVLLMPVLTVHADTYDNI